MSTVPPARRMTATTPSLGVRQWHEDGSKGEIRIAWASAGGRGMPRRAILLPVVLDGERWAPAPALWQKLQSDPRGILNTLEGRFRPDSIDVFREGGEDPRRDPAAPRPVTIRDDYAGKWEADHVLVLLIYDGPPAIGDQGDIRQPVALDRADDDSHGQEVAAISAFFENDKYDRRLVTRGLVRFPARGRETPNQVVFALASCQYPADMTDGAPGDHGGPEGPANVSLRRLAEKLASKVAGESPSLLVLAGDQIYVDATAGLFDARTQSDRLRLPYQNLMRSPGAQAVFGLLPVAMVIDDHEIVDNWEPGVPLPREATVAEALTAYRRFQRMAGPPLTSTRALWRAFEHCGVPFFLADTRTERNAPGGARDVANWRQARIMGGDQWHALRAFLAPAEPRDRVSFVVSPSMLLPRDLGLDHDESVALACDDWDGFPASRNELLAFLCDHGLSRVVFLSGDAHTSCVAHATVRRDDGQRVMLWSVHSSGLYCPYPFANGSPDDYASGEDTFVFEVANDRDGSKHEYRCTVGETQWVPGDGFAVLTLKPDVLEVAFSRARSADSKVFEIPI